MFGRRREHAAPTCASPPRGDASRAAAARAPSTFVCAFRKCDQAPLGHGRARERGASPTPADGGAAARACIPTRRHRSSANVDDAAGAAALGVALGQLVARGRVHARGRAGARHVRALDDGARARASFADGALHDGGVRAERPARGRARPLVLGGARIQQPRATPASPTLAAMQHLLGDPRPGRARSWQGAVATVNAAFAAGFAHGCRTARLGPRDSRRAGRAYAACVSRTGAASSAPL